MDVRHLLGFALTKGALVGPALCLLGIRRPFPVPVAVLVAVVMAALGATGFWYGAIVWPIMNALLGAACGYGVIDSALGAGSTDGNRGYAALLFLPLALVWFSSLSLFALKTSFFP